MNICVSQQLIMLAFQMTTCESINVCVGGVSVKQLHRILLIITEGRQLPKTKDGGKEMDFKRIRKKARSL